MFKGQIEISRALKLDGETGLATMSIDDAMALFQERSELINALEFYGKDSLDPNYDRAKWVKEMQGDLGFVARRVLLKFAGAKWVSIKEKENDPR